jgi:hypothetical protein
VIYSIQGTTGTIVKDPAAINAEDAAIAAGLSATQAEGAVTTHFHHIRMHNADEELAPTQIVTRDPVTGELEYSPLSAIAPNETTGYGTAAPTVAGTVIGSTFYVTPLGTAADAANATAAYRWDGTQWVKYPVGGGGGSTTTAPIHERDVKIATAGMTSHTLPHTPIGTVIVTRNGVDISDAWTWVDGVGTYNPANNYGCVIDEDDKIIFHYEKEGAPVVADTIAAGLTTSLAAYNAAPDGTFVPVTDAEYAAIQATVSGLAKAGQVGGLDQFTTSYDFGNLGFGATATTNTTTETLGLTKAVPANNWIYAFQFKTGDAASNRTIYLQTGPKGSNSGFSSILPAITGVTNTPGEMKNYVLKGGTQVSSEKDIAILGGSLSAARGGQLSGFWAGNGGANSVNVNTGTFPNVWAPNQGPYIQVLTTPTKQW